MKRSILLTGLFLPLLAGAQNGDSSRRSALVTTAPLLGGLTVTDVMTPITANGHTFTAEQPIVDFGVPLYKNFRTKHPVIFKAEVRYQGLFLSGEQNIGSTDFHSLTGMLSYTYMFSRATNITFVGLGGVSSDFRRNPDASDIQYTAGVRIGFHQDRSFKYGVTVAYTSDYSGTYLLPLPDIDWTISQRWSLTALLPQRVSLKYKLSPGQFLGFTSGLNTGAYRLNAGKYLQWQQVDEGLLYEVNLGRHWAANLIAGYAVSQRLETFNDDQKMSLDSFGELGKRTPLVSYRQTSFVAQAGMSYKF